MDGKWTLCSGASVRGRAVIGGGHAYSVSPCACVSQRSSVLPAPATCMCWHNHRPAPGSPGQHGPSPGAGETPRNSNPGVKVANTRFLDKGSLREPRGKVRPWQGSDWYANGNRGAVGLLIPQPGTPLLSAAPLYAVDLRCMTAVL